MKRLERLLHALLQLRQAKHARIGAGALHVLRDWYDAVIGAERNDVIAAANFFVEEGEQLGNVFVESDQDVLHFAAAWSEGVAGIVQGGITDAEEIGAAAFA